MSEQCLNLESEEDDGHDSGDDDRDTCGEALHNIVGVLDDDCDQKATESLVQDHCKCHLVETEEYSLNKV